MGILGKQDVLAGMLMIVVGGLFLGFGFDYAVGSARNMGPGYFPLILSCGLILVGFLIGARGVIADGEPIRIGTLRPLLAVLGFVVVFAVLIRPAGFLVAAICATFVAALGNPHTGWRETAVSAVVLAAAAAVLFIYLLGLPMKLVAGW